ncbi:MAG: SRPBCC family protein [Nevskia sp.]|nr:SRPBCC family protein [Nevskia sp.]
MTRTVTIAPVRKSVRINAAQQVAFEVFTAGIGRWWPKKMGIGMAPIQAVKMEPRLGGRLYELDEDQAEVVWGTVLAWDPHDRVVFTWQITSKWKPEPKPERAVNSEVEVRFVADGAEWTVVELEHRDFERMGAESGASLRHDVDNGWPGILDAYARAAGTISP